MRLAIPIATAVLAALLLAGCGGSSSPSGDSTASTSGAAPKLSAPIGASARNCDTGAVDATELRAAGVPCGQARQVMYGWQREPSCAPPPGASRSSCLTRSYRCLGARTDRGLAVSCARPGESVAFVVKRGD